VGVDPEEMEELDMDEEVRPEFECPYCYDNHDMASLCGGGGRSKLFPTSSERRWIQAIPHLFQAAAMVDPREGHDER
jgi:hypothetical protein